MSRTRTGALPLALLIAISACRRPQPVAQSPDPAPTPATLVASDEGATRRAADEEAQRQAEAHDSRRHAAASERERATRAVLEAPVLFAYDQSDLDPDARSLLDEKLALLERLGDVRLRITGHTDERGADEYNMALGQRRAAAARRYLTQRGIEATRIELNSAGEEQPLCTQSEESCWRRNRRAEFVITGGAVAGARR